jgi:hypothetical protein
MNEEQVEATIPGRLDFEEDFDYKYIPGSKMIVKQRKE